MRIDSETIIAGILLKDRGGSSQARSKNFRRYPGHVIPHQYIERLIEGKLQQAAKEAADMEAEKQKRLRDYIEKEQFKEDFLRDLKTEIQKGLAFVHDYRQINSQIAQNINVVIETRNQGANFEEKLKVATRAERALYFSSKFLEEKLNVARFLLHPDWITKRSNWKQFRAHGMVLKYLGIYTNQMDAKRLKTRLLGESRGEIIGNPDAIGVIPHTLLDNAWKYSPKGDVVEIVVSDEKAGVEFSVSSYGPCIDEDERKRIFEAFYRGRNAERQEEEGVGYGLYVAQMVAKQIGTEIEVGQDIGNTSHGAYWTTFRVVFPYARN